MSNLEVIEALCDLVNQQLTLIHHLVVQLAEARSLTDAEQQMIEDTKAEYSALLGADEAPDYLD